MALVNIKINGQPYQVEAGLTVLEAAKKCGYQIPSLCAFNHGKCSLASCRVCLVEVKGARGLVASCAYPVNEGMEIITNSQKAVEARRASVELILSNHQKIEHFLQVFWVFKNRCDIFKNNTWLWKSWHVLDKLIR